MQTLINSPDIVHQALLPVKMIVPSATNPRKRISEQMLDELAASIAKVGVLQPILVRAHPENELRYEIVAGECRWRATVQAGLQDIPAIIRDLTDLEALELQVLENLHRTDLHPLEEAEGFQQLLDANGYTVDTLASKLGKSKAVVYASLKLCALCPAGREAFYDGKLTASTALLVARIPGAKLQEKALKEITKLDPYTHAAPSYRYAAQLIRSKYTLALDRAIFDVDDSLLLASAGDCQSCEKRSGNCRELYPDIDSADVCTDPTCFAEKRQAHVDKLLKDPNTITGEEAKNILPHGGHYVADSNFGSVYKRCDIPGRENQTWTQLLGEETPTRTVIVKGQSPVTLIDLSAAKKLAEEKSLGACGPSEAEADRTRVMETARQEKAAAEAEIGWREAMLDELHTRLADEATLQRVFRQVVLPILLIRLLNACSDKSEQLLFAKFGDPDPDSDPIDYVSRLTDHQRLQMLAEITPMEIDDDLFGGNYYHGIEDLGTPETFSSILRAAGIDPDAPATPDSEETPPPPTSAAHAEIETARAEEPAEAPEEAAAEPAAQADEPSAEAQPEATPIQAADKPAARKRGRPRKQAAPTPAEVVQ